MMEKQSSNVTINVQGSYIDVHGNENVYLSIPNGKSTLKISDTPPECPKAAPDKAKPQLTLRDLVKDKAKADALISSMHTLMHGQKGKMAAMLVCCAMEKQLLSSRPTFEQMTAEFGDIGARNGYYSYLKVKFSPEEKKPIEDSLKACLEKT